MQQKDQGLLSIKILLWSYSMLMTIALGFKQVDEKYDIFQGILKHQTVDPNWRSCPNHIFSFLGIITIPRAGPW